MTIAEVNRAVQSYNRRERRRAKEIAMNNYILADLIGASVGRLYKGTFPQIEEVYPSLFADEVTVEEVQQTKDELSAKRFLLFAQAYNAKHNGGESK